MGNTVTKKLDSRNYKSWEERWGELRIGEFFAVSEKAHALRQKLNCEEYLDPETGVTKKASTWLPSLQVLEVDVLIKFEVVK